MSAIKVLDQYQSGWASIYNADTCEAICGVPDESIHFSVFSPPFESLFTYSASERDLGNSHGRDQFADHLSFIAAQQFRTMKLGRMVAIHCMDLPMTLTHHGQIGFIDFPARLREVYERAGFVYYGRITIWKDPVVAQERTHARQLVHHEMVKDSAMSGVGCPDYIVLMRKPGKNEAPIAHNGDALATKNDAGKPEHWQRVASPVWGMPESELDALLRRLAIAIRSGYDGDAERIAGDCARQFQIKEGKGIQLEPLRILPSLVWATANGLWRDGFVDYEDPRAGNPDKRGIDQGDTLNFRAAREHKDERHICVAAGSLVLTRDGHKPIEHISVGEEVLTHLGRWRKVTAKQCNGIRRVVKLKAQGVPGLTVTPDHKVWTRLVRGEKPRKKMLRTNPTWEDASTIVGSYVNLPLPPIQHSDLSLHEWWIVGRWLGDGYFDARGHAHICCGKHETDKLVEHLGARAGFIARNVKTADHVTVLDPTGNLRTMLRKCGKLAHGKKLPGEALSLDESNSTSLLSGYLSADGHYTKMYDRHSASSVSRALLLGMAMVAQRANGVAVSVYAGRAAGTYEIEGRKVTTRDDWIMSIPPRNVSGAILNDGAWRKVRSVSDAGMAEVWDLQVEEDESFIAEGCAVHNCPLQKGVVDRLLDLYTNPGEIVLTPFMGIGTEVVCSIAKGRRGVGFELKGSYYRQAVEHVRRVEPGAAGQQTSIFDLTAKPVESPAVVVDSGQPWLSTKQGVCADCQAEGSIGACDICGGNVR